MPAAIRLAPTLTPPQIAAIEERIAGIEARFGVQVVTAVVGKCDHYPELPWTAFALGASVAGLMAVALEVSRPDLYASGSALWCAIAMLGTGATCALLCMVVPGFARWFLRDIRAQGEIEQYARGMFLARELFRVPGRTGVLLLASLFERRVVVRADTGFAGRVDGADWRALIERMTPELAAGRPAEALLDGLVALDSLLSNRAFPSAVAMPDAPSDRPVQERGA